MKHIKRFNESLSDEDILRDFCEENLAYLLDDLFRLEIIMYNFERSYLPIRAKIKIHACRDKYHHWSELKDCIIPFLKRLDSKYLIMFRWHLHKKIDKAVNFYVKSLKPYPANFNGAIEKDIPYTLDDVLEDKYLIMNDDEMLIRDICINVMIK